jgi:hypothetical protein
MKTKYTLFRRGGIYYSQDSATGQQKSLRTRDEAEALKLINARNEAHRQPVLNLHLARAYLTANDPAFVERTWQTVMGQLQSRGKDSSRERYASVFKSASFDGLRHKKLLETTADDFFAVFKQNQVSINEFLKRLHNFALSLGWIALPIVAPYLCRKEFDAIGRRIAQRLEQLGRDQRRHVMRLAVQHPRRLFRREAGGQLAKQNQEFMLVVAHIGSHFLAG